MSYSVEVITKPSVYPITLEQARLHLKVDAEGSPPSHPDDDLIEAQIAAATEFAENYLGYAIASQQLKLYLDSFPSSDTITLPRSHLISIDTVEYYDTDGVLQEWASSNYEADTHSEEGRLLRLPDIYWPDTQVRYQSVRITYTAGYPSQGSPPDYLENIPKSIIAAIKLFLTDLYEQRQELIVGSIFTSTKAGLNLLHPLRRIYLR